MKKFKQSKGAPGRSAKAKSATIVIYDSETEETLRQLKDRTPEFDRQARQDGARGVPAADQRALCDTELEIKAKFEESLRFALTSISQRITNLQTNLAAKRQLSELLATDPQAALEELRQQKHNSLVQELQAIEEEADSKTELLERKKKTIQHELTKDYTEKNITEDNIGYRPRKKSWWSKALYLFFFLFAVLTDVSVTFKNIEATAKTPLLASLVVAIAIALILALDAHHLGRSIKTRNRKGLMLSLILAGLVMVVVGFLALSFGSWITAMINLTMLVGLALLAYFYSEEKADLVKKYFDDQAAIKAGEKKITDIDKQIHNVRTKSKAKMLETTRAYRAEIVDEYNMLNEKLVEWQEYRNLKKDQFTALYQQQFHRYRKLNQQERVDKNIPQVKWWLESTHVPSLRISESDPHDTAEVSIPLPPSGNGNGTLSKVGFQFLLVLLLGTMAMGSCNFLTPVSGVAVDVRIPADQTDSIDFDPEAIAKFILSMHKFDSAKTYDASISIEVIRLNDRYANPTFFAHLPERGNTFFEVTHERLAEQGVFYRQVVTALTEGHRFTGEIPHSRLYGPICEVLQDLQHSTAKQRQCLIFSDGLENTKGLSFYDYRHNPALLLEEKDKIIAELEKQCPLPDLSGIEIWIIHQPSLELDELGHYVKLFWKEYFQSHGATVHLLAGVNGAFVTK
jgi:hypothetical protein